MFKSVQDVIEQLGQLDYICDKKIATVVFLAQQLGKPVLVEGPAGVGKTELAKVVSKALGRNMIRLQCYEGLDEAKALYEWEYAKQLLYTQLLRDRIGEALGGAREARHRSADLLRWPQVGEARLEEAPRFVLAGDAAPDEDLRRQGPEPEAPGEVRCAAEQVAAPRGLAVRHSSLSRPARRRSIGSGPVHGPRSTAAAAMG